MTSFTSLKEHSKHTPDHAAQRIQSREENQRQKRLRQALRRDIDADLPL